MWWQVNEFIWTEKGIELNVFADVKERVKQTKLGKLCSSRG